MKDTTEFHKKITRNFSASAFTYDKHAELQKSIAERLASSLEPWKYIVPKGNILEIGCGTGFFTDHLSQMFCNRQIDVTDISTSMVKIAQNKFGDREHLHFSKMNAEEDIKSNKKYSLISGNYVVQWFSNPALTLERLANSLKPGGLMLFSFPGENTFPEWKRTCVDLGIPFTANEMPAVEPLVIHLSMGPLQIDFHEDETKISYNSPIDFFKHLKLIGANTKKSTSKLSVKQVLLLEKNWPRTRKEKIVVTYHNVFLAAKKTE